MNDNKYIKNQLKLGMKTAEAANILDDIKKTYSDNPDVYKPMSERVRNAKTSAITTQPKNRRKLFALASSLAAVMLVVAVGIYFLVNSNTAVSVAAPTNIQINNGVLMWDPVPNATGYQVYVDGVIYNTTEPNFSLPALTGENCVIKVLAKGNSGNYSDSNWSQEQQYTTYLLTVNSIGGFVSSAGGYYVENASITLTATPYTDYEFDGWYSGGIKISENFSYTFNMPAAALTLQARFDHEYLAGSGSATDPNIIITKEQLIYFRDKVNTVDSYSQNKYFALGGDIDLEGMEWIPIGMGMAFQGNFDGRGFLIYNFEITELLYRPKVFGLFGSVFGAAIKNLGVSGFIIGASETDNDEDVYAGGLAGRVSDSIISNCYATGDISINSNLNAYAGGLFGCIENTYIFDCYAVVNVSAEAYEDAFAGGIAGYSFISNYISNCYAAGDVSASGQCAYAGGFVAYSITESESVFNNCYRYEEQIIDAQGPLPIINTEGLECNLSDLNSSEFYIETLLWDLDIWDFTELDFASDKYPQFLNEGRLPLWNP